MNDAMFSSKSDMWGTPQKLFDLIDSEFHFTTDVCATESNAKCKKYYSTQDDGLKQTWEGCCWCNPPYGRQIGKWVKKASESKCTTVMLLPARTDTAWFHDYIYGKAEVRFIRGRIHFERERESRHSSVSEHDCNFQK